MTIMRQIIKSVVILLLVSACQSVNFNDVNMVAPNARLLPPMEAKISRKALKENFDTVKTEDGRAYVYDDSFQFAGATYQKDRRPRDVETVFIRNMDNITQSYGEKKGTITLRVSNTRAYHTGYFYTVPSVLTLHIANLFGLPYVYDNMDVTIADKKGNPVRKYIEVGHAETPVAMYYGYSTSNAPLLSTIRATQDALRKINMQIANDFEAINSQLK